MIHQIMHQAAANGLQQFAVLDQVAKNIANFNTPAYKGVRFEQYLMPDGRVEGAIRTDTSKGQPLITRRELDVAITSDGYLPVTQPDGTTAYTRDGSFTKGKDGYLYTLRGDLVGNGIQLPTVYEKMMILQDGTIKVNKKAGTRDEIIGKLNLVVFDNPEGLETIGGNKVVESERSGQPKLLADGQFAQGKLERSNINIPMQIDQILRLNAGVISNLRVIKFSDDLYRQAVSLRQ
jgi:flagellar basal-body rod protein FlgG